MLALQGDVREHLAALQRVRAIGVPVRRATELADLDGIIVPGGESTTIGKLLSAFDLLEPLRAALRAGLPAYGSCAGMVLLADDVIDGRPDHPTLGGLDITVRRNAFGRQVDSFEADLTLAEISGDPVRAVFIRAPWVERVGPAVEVLATRGGHPVAVRQGRLLATSFHPELAGDDRVHRLFVTGLAASASVASNPRQGTGAT